MGVLARGRWGPVLVAVAAVLIGNALIAALGLRGDQADSDLPGWLIGSVWVVLFAFLGTSYAALVRAPAETSPKRKALVGLGVLCLLYPAYTGGFEIWAISFGGVIVTFVYAGALVLWIGKVSPEVALWLLPLLLWLVFAGYLLL